MSPDRDRVDALLDELIDLSETERARRLAVLQTEDPALHDELVSLITAFRAAGDFLEVPIGEFVAGAATGADRSGEVVGQFELIERIGHGGMGEVYLGRRASADYEQRVAVKLMRGTVIQNESLHRFRNECRVLARLDHPNIARMIDGSITGDGVPYLVMEYVEGESIDAYCRTRRLGVRERVLLLRQVCAAVAALHRHSTIHRDIKPANVLVTGDGRVKLIDFGIARALSWVEGAGDVTLAGFERMTPTYASPEQLRGDDLTTTSDVYSLGVLAFEVLTGRLPYRSRTRRDLEREMTGTAVTRPSAAARDQDEVAVPARALEGDLDTILLMALRHEAERRYPSVEQFDEDLRRYLEGLPVVARDDTFAYRAGKFVRRHALAVTLAGLAAIILVAATIVSATLFGRAESARIEAERERAKAVAVSDFLQDLLESAGPMATQSRSDLTVREVLDSAAARLESDVALDRAVRRTLHMTAGTAYGALVMAKPGLEHFARAESLLGPEDHDDRANIRVRRAELEYTLAHYDVADSLFGLVVDHPEGIEPGPVAVAHMSRGRLYIDLSRFEEAEFHLRRAREMSMAPGGDPMTLVQSTSQLGVLAFRQGQMESALDALYESVELSRRHLGHTHAMTGVSLNNLGLALGPIGRFDEAIQALREALRVTERAYDPENREAGLVRVNLADAYLYAGRHAEARDEYEHALRILRKASEEENDTLATAHANLAYARWQLGELEKAVEGFGQAVAMYRKVLGPEHPWVANCLVNLGRVQVERGDRVRARELGAEGERMLRAAFPDGHHLLARPLRLLAELDLHEDRVDDALERSAEAERLVAGLPVVHRDRVAATVTRARALQSGGRRDEARAHLLATRDAITAVDSTSAELIRIRDVLAALDEE